MVPREVYAAGLLVPQEAVTRDPSGKPQLIIIAADKTGIERTVELGPLVDGKYLVKAGLAAGETIVVLGQERVQDGQPLDTLPMQAPPETQS